MNKDNIGSNFDDFLTEEGIDVEAINKQIADDFARAFKEKDEIIDPEARLKADIVSYLSKLNEKLEVQQSLNELYPDPIEIDMTKPLTEDEFLYLMSIGKMKLADFTVNVSSPSNNSNAYMISVNLIGQYIENIKSAPIIVDIGKIDGENSLKN